LLPFTRDVVEDVEVRPSGEGQIGGKGREFGDAEERESGNLEKNTDGVALGLVPEYDGYRALD
jgi:hypothetical protein